MGIYTEVVIEQKKVALFLLTAILLLAAFFRFYRLSNAPPGLYPDEAANGNNAVEVLRSGSAKIFYPENNGREGLYINLQAVSIKLLGAEPGALRVVSAVFGMLTVLGLYLLVKELFSENPKPEVLNPKQALNSNDQNNKPFLDFRHLGLSRNSSLGLRTSRGQFIALLSSFFLATSFWHVNFSRIGFRAIMVPFFGVFAMYWLLKALRTGNIWSAVAGGLAFGLGFHTYIAFRFMPLVAAVPILFSLARWRRGRTCSPCVVALFLLAAIIAALPMGLYFLGHPADFFGRSGQVSILSAASPLKEFLRSSALTLGMFNIYGDCNARHNLACQPMLFWPVGVLFVIGLGLTVRDLFRKSASFVPYTIAAWFLFLMLPAALTREGLPHALRAIGLIPPVMLLSAQGGAWVWETLTAAVKRALADPKNAAYARQLRRIATELSVAGLAFLLWIGVAAYRDYFIRFATSPATADAFATDLLAAGRYIRDLPDDLEKVVVVNLSGEDIRGVPAPAQTVMFASDTFDADRRRERNVTYVSAVSEIRIDSERPAVIIPLNREDRETIAAIHKRFPALRGRVENGVLIFATK